MPAEQVRTECWNRNKRTMATQHIELTSGELALRFSTTGYLSLESLSGDGLYEWLDRASDGSAVWALTFRGPDGTSPTYRPGDSHWLGTEEDPATGGFVARWRIALAPDAACEVRMSVRAVDGHSLSAWNLEADVPDRWQIILADFPVLPNLKCPPGAKLAVPSGWGVEYDLVPGIDYEGHYPSCLAGMQFMAAYASGHGLYIGAHDPAGSIKTLRVRAGTTTARAWIHYPPPLSGKTTFRVPYDTLIGTFRGGCVEAAAMYREFTFRTPWGRGEGRRRRATPQWLEETDLWLRPDGGAEQNIEVTRRALEYFDAPTALHWYRWHVIPYDTNYPEYLPALPGISEAVAEMQRLGSRVVPYVNGRLWDPASTSWRNEGGAAAAARQIDGTCYTEVYGSRIPNNAACPATETWRRQMVSVVHDVAAELGVDGIYIDQIGAARGVPCYAENHEHQPGGGDFWHLAYRQLLEQVRSDHGAGDDFILTTEENAECWIDQFDALLLVNTPTDGTPIPMFPVVYSGRAITYGFLYFPADDLIRSLPFRLKMARCLLWGSQLGWIQPARIMAPEASADACFLRELVHVRPLVREYFLRGRFLRETTPGGDNPPITGIGSGSFSGSYAISVPSVLGAVWQAAGRDAVALVLVNLTDTPRTVTAELPLGDVHVTTPSACKVQLKRPGAGTQMLEACGTRVDVEVPEGSGVVLEVRAPSV